MFNSIRYLARKTAPIAAAIAIAGATLSAAPTFAQDQTVTGSIPPKPVHQRYTSQEIVDVGHGMFGKATSGLASVVERAVSTYGQPNGYILGEEASAAIVGGLRYGEGYLYTKNAGSHRVFWQGPSIGWDFGGDGNRTMILVYNIESVDRMYRRFLGVSGQAYAIGGLGMTVMQYGDTLLVPIRTGVGARLGVNVGYLKLRKKPTWNPF